MKKIEFIPFDLWRENLEFNRLYLFAINKQSEAGIIPFLVLFNEKGFFTYCAESGKYDKEINPFASLDLWTGKPFYFSY